MLFNKKDDEDGIIIFFESSRLTHPHYHRSRITAIIFKIIKIVKIITLFLAGLFLYHRLPYFISSIIYNIKKFLSF